MAGIVVRPYEERDEDGFCTVMSLVYNNGMPIEGERRQSRFGDRFVADSHDEIVGAFTTLSLSLTRGPSTFRCAAVGGVGVSPDLRRSGVGVQMMKWSVAHFKETGYPLGALFAFREPFYAKAGYSVCGKRVKLSVPVHRLPKVQSNLRVRRLGPSDWQELHPCYSKFAHSRSGTNIRTEQMWERVLAEGKPLVVYAAGDPVEGYVAVSHAVAFWEDQWLSEVAWSTSEGYDACLEIMHRVGINKTSVSWFEPSDSPYYARYLDQGVSAELSRPAMFRVCDVKTCLEGLHPTVSGRFTLKVLDQDIPDNCGPWEVTFEEGQTNLRPLEFGEADLEMDIREFTQAFLGEPSLAELAHFGSVKVTHEKGLAAALQLLPASPVFLGDFF